MICWFSPVVEVVCRGRTLPSVQPFPSAQFSSYVFRTGVLASSFTSSATSLVLRPLVIEWGFMPAEAAIVATEIWWNALFRYSILHLSVYCWWCTCSQRWRTWTCALPYPNRRMKDSCCPSILPLLLSVSLLSTYHLPSFTLASICWMMLSIVLPG